MESQSKASCVMSDEMIVDLYFRRDERAIRETDVKYKKFLLSVAMNIVGDMCDSEECLNDTYIGAWNSIPPSRPAVLRSFLGSIMRRTAIDRFRANRRQKRIASEFIVSLSEIEDIIADDSDMNAVTEAEELAKSINDFVRALPNRRMYVFVARYYLADPIAKIGDELGCSISTVEREIEAIRTGLRKHLEGEGYII